MTTCDGHKGMQPKGCGVCAEMERAMLEAKLMDLLRKMEMMERQTFDLKFREATTK